MNYKYRKNLPGFLLAIFNIFLVWYDFKWRSRAIIKFIRPDYPNRDDGFILLAVKKALVYAPPLISLAISVLAIMIPPFAAGKPWKRIIIPLVFCTYYNVYSVVISRFRDDSSLLVLFGAPYGLISMIYMTDDSKRSIWIRFKPWTLVRKDEPANAKDALEKVEILDESSLPASILDIIENGPFKKRNNNSSINPADPITYTLVYADNTEIKCKVTDQL